MAVRKLSFNQSIRHSVNQSFVKVSHFSRFLYIGSTPQDGH